MTSSGSFFRGRFDEKIASKASVLEIGGTVVVTEIGRWMEKNEATWTSNGGKRKVSFGHFFTHKGNLCKSGRCYSPWGWRCCVEGTLGSFENAACCWLDFDEPLRAELSLRRRVALLFSLDELTPFAGAEVSMRREPSLGGTGGLEDEEEYRRWCRGRVAPSRPLVTF